MEPAVPSRKKQIITALAVLVAITLIVVATVGSTKKPSDTMASITDASPASSKSATDGTSVPASDAASPKSNTTAYTDGTYTANATYQSPGGTEKLAVKLTLKNGVVTDSTLTSTPTEREAKEYQTLFISNYKSQVVGKSVDTIKLSRVSGSSLTSQGFNSALATIKQQAQG